MAKFNKKPVAIPAKFKKKPVFVEAFQLTHKNAEEIIQWIKNSNPHVYYGLDGNIRIWTSQGPVTVNRWDWVIHGVSGEFYSCKPDTFEKRYEPT